VVNRQIIASDSVCNTGRSAEPFSLAKCRKILGNACPESNSDLERLRDQLYGLARATVEAFIETPRRDDAPRPLNDAGCVFGGEGRAKPPADFADALDTLPEDERYVLEERAAIHEFEGKLDRNAAELVAFSEFWREKCPKNDNA